MLSGESNILFVRFGNINTKWPLRTVAGVDLGVVIVVFSLLMSLGDLTILCLILLMLVPIC